jgi:hypothetical protein
MLIQEFSKPISAKSLNETMAKKFGTKINLDKFTVEQLEDVRNRLRTQLSQVETNESYGSIAKSDTYQKTKMFLDVINTALEEKKGKPDFLDLDKDGDKKEPMKKAAKEAGKGKGGKPKKGKVPPQFQKESVSEGKKEKAVCKECGDEFGKPTTDCKNDCNDPTQDCWVKESEYKKMDESLNEGAEEEATLVMAAKDMVDRITGWMEDTAEMQTESMLELADKIRDEMGVDKSDEFTGSVKPALESLYDSLESTRGALTGGVAILTGEGAPETMGDEVADDDMDMEPTVDADAETDDPEGDEFATADPAAGGEEPADREKRESVELSKRLGLLLADSKKKA